MSVFRCRGKWKAEVWIGSRRIKTKAGFETKSLAKRWHDDISREYRDDPTKAKRDKILFDELLERFVAMHMPTLRKETERRYKIELDLRIEPFFKGREVGAIAPEMIARFRMEVMKSDLSPKSVNNCISVLRLIFTKAKEWGLIRESPYNLKPLKIPSQKYTWWDSKEDIAKFLAAAKRTPYYAAYRLALDTGMRLGEVVGLSKADVDFARSQIHVHRQWIDKQRCYGPTKGNRERFINFDPQSDLGPILREAIRRSPHKEAIFVTSTGERVGARKLGGYHFQEVIKKAKVPRIKFHDLRHTFASWYMIEVDDIWSLKSILGHSDITTTQRYAHLSQKHQRVPTMQWGEFTPDSRSHGHLRIVHSD